MIEVCALTKHYGSHVAVNDVSFTVNAGETFALLGPNGSGKTTTLKCLVGLVAPTKGTIRISQYDIWKSVREARKMVSYLPQRVTFPENLTAREVLSFYSQIRRIDPGCVGKLLATPQFHFNGFSNKPVSQYSGGMIQRLGLAVACLPDTPVLILDEPTVGLDPEGAIQFREFLAALKRSGKTLVLSSHVLADVEQLADRVGIMVGGRLVALESISALRQGLIHDSRIRVELASSNPTYAEAAYQAGARNVEIQDNILLIASPPEDRLQILRAIEATGGKVVRFSSQEPSLEDVYLRYTARGGADDGHDST
jgi:Cu-processing system ATP-binding protein